MRVFLGILVAVMAGGVAAQELGGDFGGDLDAAFGTESEEETIRKCLRDLQSDEVHKRQRAVLILGKYTGNAQATRALLGAIDDPAAKIRRSVLVALSESKRGLPLAAGPLILRRLGDVDVEVRRLASNLAGGAARIGRIMYHNGTGGSALPEGLQRRVIAAFADADPVVRKNMIDNYRDFRSFVPESAIAKLLHDPKREVRVLALKAAPDVFSHRRFVQAVRHLAEDDNRYLRLLLARQLARGYFSGKEELLRKLTEDRDFEVATVATMALFRAGEHELWPQVKRRLHDQRLDPDTGRQIIQYLPELGEAGAARLLELLRHPRPSFRESALRVLNGKYPRKLSVARLGEALGDPSRSLRELAGTYLLARGTPPPAIRRDILRSRFVDVRRLALRFVHSLNKQVAKDALMELMLDESTELRRQALLAMARRGLPDWIGIAGMTLDDPNEQLRTTAADLLLRDLSKAAVGELTDFLARSADTEFKFSVAEKLQLRLQQQPERKPEDAP